MVKCFMKLSNFKFEQDRILAEIMHWTKSARQPKPVKAQSFSLTTVRECVNDANYKFTRFQGITTRDATGVRRTPDGVLDSDIIHWPVILQDSYMKEVGDKIAAFLEMPSYRTRCSFISAGEQAYPYPFHNDEHTPFRVHLALLTTPETNWLFKNNSNEIAIHQPADGVPSLIDTGSVQHSFFVPANTIRIHFWYQYYQPVKQDILDKLIGISC